MASNNRIMYVGDTYPIMMGQASDETGVLDLSGASSLEMNAEGASFEFSGTAAAIHPATADPDGVHFWNWSYTFAGGDTANVDVYNIYLVVTWSMGNIETFAGGTLTVLAPE